MHTLCLRGELFDYGSARVRRVHVVNSAAREIE